MNNNTGCIWSAQGNVVCQRNAQSDPVLNVAAYSCARPQAQGQGQPQGQGCQGQSYNGGCANQQSGSYAMFPPTREGYADEKTTHRADINRCSAIKDNTNMTTCVENAYNKWQKEGYTNMLDIGGMVKGMINPSMQNFANSTGTSGHRDDIANNGTNQSYRKDHGGRTHKEVNERRDPKPKKDRFVNYDDEEELEESGEEYQNAFYGFLGGNSRVRSEFEQFKGNKGNNGNKGNKGNKRQ